jgi:hypothetical protein
MRGLKAESNREGLGVHRVAFYIWRSGSIEGRELGIEKGESWRSVLVICYGGRREFDGG